MKTITKYILLTVCVLSAGCTQQPAPIDVDMAIIRDITDPMVAVPNVEDITAPLGLKANPWQSIRIHVTTISDKDINDVSVVTLEAENRWTGNITLRKATIEQFKKRLAQCLAITPNKTLPYSIVYRAVARQANSLAISTARKRYLLVYSDLRENSNLNFYNPETVELVCRNPALVAKKLTDNKALPDLSGVQVYLLYSPASYRQNEVYMPIAHLYEQIYTAHHALLYIQSQFSMQ
jgi:hypothetical protein